MRDLVWMNGKGNVIVDTALLFDSTDVWETMVFEADEYGNIESFADLAMDRCKGTEADALEMHKAMIEYVKGL